MFKKCYLGIIANDEGRIIGTVILRGWKYRSAKWFYDQLSERLSNGTIIDFKRIK